MEKIQKTFGDKSNGKKPKKKFEKETEKKFWRTILRNIRKNLEKKLKKHWRKQKRFGKKFESLENFFAAWTKHELECSIVRYTAVIQGIQGVNSSEWFPMIQSMSLNRSVSGLTVSSRRSQWGRNWSQILRARTSIPCPRHYKLRRFTDEPEEKIWVWRRRKQKVKAERNQLTPSLAKM